MLSKYTVTRRVSAEIFKSCPHGVTRLSLTLLCDLINRLSLWAALGNELGSLPDSPPLPMTSTMAPRNGSRSDNVDPTNLGYPPDDLHVDEREPLTPKTGENVKKLSRLHVFWNDTREVAQRNNGLLLVMAGEGLFAVTDAIVKTLQKVDPPVTTLQVRL